MAKPKKTHDRASKRSMTGAEAAEQAANKAERAVARPIPARQDENEEDQGVLVLRTPPPPGESQGGTTITLATRTPACFRGPPGLIPTLVFEPESSPEAEVQLPASTAAGRIEDGARKRCRMADKWYTESQHEL